MVLNDLKLDEDVEPGVIRRHSVVVGSVYKGAPPEDCFYLLERMCDYIESTDHSGDDKHHMAILAALFAHMYMALIHPYGDGNGRTARLLEYYILLRAGFPQPTGHLLSNHYNLTRSRYYTELDLISKSGGDMGSFINYALEGFIDGLKEQIEFIRNEQLSVAWVNYVHEQFQGKKTVSDLRRRELVLQLANQDKPVRISEVMDMTPRLAREYADKTDKTLTRDVNVLVQMGLVRRVPGRRVRACNEIIRAFLPWRAEAVC